MGTIDLSPGAFSPKQLDFISFSYRPINIAVGAVQSGKSWCLNVTFALYIVESPHKRFLICGNTRDTVQDNVIENGLRDICEELLGKENVHYNKIDGTFSINVGGIEKVCKIVGINNKGATDRLKGKPVGGSLLDEITTYPTDPLDMAFARNSLAGSRIFCSSNPDSPRHPVFTKYVGNKEKIKSGKVRVWNFNHDDNPTLTDERKEFYRDTFKGVFYQRNVLGRWVMAEGAIYDMFLESENVIRRDSELRLEPDDFDDFIVGCDYGTGSVTTFVLIGIKRQMGRIGLQNYYYAIREFYYDSREAEGVRMTDPQLVAELKKFLYRDWRPPVLKAIYVDSSASSFIEQLFFDNIEEEFNTTILGANRKNVIKGISKVSTLIGQRRLKFYEECKEAITEFQTYMWDPTKRKAGKSEPLSENDHTCDAIRYAITGYGGESIAFTDDEDAFPIASMGNKIMGV